MRKSKEDNLMEDVQKCMTDPIYSVIKNFSLEKSEEHYKKWVEKWNEHVYEGNPAVVVESETFPFTNLEEMSRRSNEAQILMDNMKEMGHIKCVEWEIYGDNIVVDWYRLKTYDEWLHDGLLDALMQAKDMPEDGVRMILERELGKGVYTNTAVHLFVEGKIDRDVLIRLGQYEWYWKIPDRDIEKDIEEAKRALEDLKEENKKKDVTVLTLRM